VRRRVLVTGIGVITPIGNTVETFWSNLLAGTSGVAPIQTFNPADLEVRIAAEVQDFDPAAFMPGKDARRMERFAQFAVAASRLALEDAALAITAQNTDVTGIVLNTGIGGATRVAVEEPVWRERGPKRVTPLFVPLIAPNMAACQPALQLGIHGPVISSVGACAAGTMAMVEALRLIRAGDAEVVLAGGTEAGLLPLAVAGLINLQVLSRRNAEPQRASRPFDKDRDGFVLGEGAAVLVLESEDYALARGARVLCELAGGALTCDAYHITAPLPDGSGAAKAITLGLRDAAMQPEEIDYIAAHGTSTQLNDAAETIAIKRAFGEHASRLAISANKSMIGHLFGAAGAVSAATCALAIRDGIVPPTINLETPDPECDLDYVPGVARRQPVHAAMANAFGFGGQNAIAVFRSYRE
jgi:3-oxoacyl-[acyl-carrier-protein] synthase II